MTVGGDKAFDTLRVCGRVPKSAGGAARDAELGRRGGSKSGPTCGPEEHGVRPREPQNTVADQPADAKNG